MRYRTFSEADFAALAALDLDVQRRADPAFDTLEAREQEGRLRTSLGALKFFERSEHSFLAEDERGVQGLILAQPVWQGDRPIVLVVQTLLSAGAGPEAAAGLLHACIKSAYDTAVYEVHFPLTPELEAAAEVEAAHVVGRYAVRHLGSRLQTAPGQQLGAPPGPPESAGTNQANTGTDQRQ
ncbi:DUF1999 domain-containing protein [Deinococcus irradiatisoli]|uniref:DUF1999 domain-containing protein n=1 Tax=Deinococcus irradiatisoli TaxID=2202254 RepID=A0A2Z3JGG9_9DEIO|nr:DUF1999 domain-containing protein [Deinococcus irradiatisoli]AWN22440.1 DUF1999 domain-containing protein [Deinococcus irradiatisoli]